MFADFVKKFDKKYSTEAEKEKRFQIFSNNADMSAEEFTAQYSTGFKQSTMLKSEKDSVVFTAPAGFEAPESVDWVEKGCVTDVKNQGTCGSCWSFSAAGALEGAMCVAGRPLVSLSEQQIIACDTNGKGCNGGSMDDAFDFVSQNGLASFKDEPYLCVDGQSAQCQQMQCDS